MKSSNEQKHTIIDRFLSATSKLKHEWQERRAATSSEPLDYGLPKSFVQAVDKARLEAGYDIIPRPREPSLPRPQSNPQKSSSVTSVPCLTYDVDDTSLRKVPFRRAPVSVRPLPPHQPPRPMWPPPLVRTLLSPTPRIINRPRLLFNRGLPPLSRIPLRPALRITRPAGFRPRFS